MYVASDIGPVVLAFAVRKTDGNHKKDDQVL